MELEEGCTCPGCGVGVLEYATPKNCSCHISAPCNAHTSAPLECNKCGEEFAEDVPDPVKPAKFVYDCYARRHSEHSDYFLRTAEIDYLYERDPFGAYGMFNLGLPYPDDFGLLFFAEKTNPFCINFASIPHSTCSMIKRGWAPPWVSKEEAVKTLNGTFGGRFSYFHKNGQFEFIAYTD